MSKEGNKQPAPQAPAQPTPAAVPKPPAAAPEAAQQKKDYIGCLMSLISKQEIRYVGTLVAINSKDQTLVLQNVKTYGSEGRRGGGADELPASNQMYERVVFRAAELKDFYVIKGPEKDFKDPAILSTEKVEEKKEEKKQPAATVAEPAAAYSAGPSHGYEEPSYQYQYEYSAPSRRGRGHYPRARGSPRRVEGAFQEHTVKEVQEKYGGEFDFEAMNKKFEELFKEKEAKVEVGIKYDKAKSFYDAISRGKEEKTDTPFDRHKQRQIDATTFDLDPQYYERRGGYHTRYRGGSGGRYYGGYRRGRGMGGGRGQQSPSRRGQPPQYYRKRA